jgi:twinkle protein
MMDEDSCSNVTTADFRDSPQRMSPEGAAWLKDKRGISRQTWEKLHVAAGTVFFPEIKRKSKAVFFKYPDGWKARSIEEKAFTQKQGTTQTFWNLEAVLAGPLDQVYIVEGEMDALAMVEAGIPSDRVLAAPSGSALSYVEDALAAGLGRAKGFVWCGDQDEVGLELRVQMAKLLGAARFSFIEWPEGTKDANDFLRADGRDDLLDRVMNGQRDWPIEGLFRLSAIPEMQALIRWSTGFEGWDSKLCLAPGTMSVVTGHPGMGKTQLWTQIWFQTALLHDLVVAVASFETGPKPHLQRALRTLHCRRPPVAFDVQEVAAADEWIDAHYQFIIHPERRPTREWTLETAAAACIKHGARVVQIDPWNRLEANREKGESETDYIGRCLRALYNFARDMRCHVQILAHPSKVDAGRRGTVPELEDIAGSKHWDNMVDQGFVVHRPRMFDDDGNRVCYAELHHKKARFEELGFPTKFGLEFDPDQGRYGTCLLAKAKPKTSKQEAQQAKPEDYDSF